MLRHVGYACLVVGFAAAAFYGLAGWARGPSASRAEVEAGLDEIPLQEGALTRHALQMDASRGYPWPALRETLQIYKRDLPPDLAVPSAEDSEKRVILALSDLKLTMPTGPLTWPQVLAALRERFEPVGVKVLAGTPKMQPPEGFTIELPYTQYTGIQVLSYMYPASQQMIGYRCSSEGVCVGTSRAVNYEMSEARLIELRRRVAPEHAAPVLDAEFRPDFIDAPMGAISRVIYAQTGVELVADPELWDTGVVIKWRGEARKLRDALDQLSVKLHAYWRFRDGRVWLLKP
jgi:hypothetical protein